MRSLSSELEATRNPRLLFRFSGVFLFRFADRQFLGLSFQLPPRFTRFEPALDKAPYCPLLSIRSPPSLAPYSGSWFPVDRMRR